MVATIISGCSIRNIRYQDTDECGKEGEEIKINGDLMEAGNEIVLPSHSGINFLQFSIASQAKNKRVYKYDIYS